MILGLWLLTLLTPESLLFASGDLRRLLDLPTPLQFNPTRFMKVEAAIAASQLVAVGLTARSMMREWSPWPVLLLVLLGLGAKTLAAAAFFSPGDPLHWATPGGQIGLAAGAAILTYSEAGASLKALGQFMAHPWPPTGRLPVEIPGVQPQGAGLSRVP